MNTILTFFSLPLVFADWVYGWTIQPLDHWYSGLPPFTKVYLWMFVLYVYLVHLINRTRREFYAVLTEEQKKQFMHNRYSFSNTTFSDYLSGCWFGFSIFFILYYLYKWTFMGICFLVDYFK